MTAYEHVERFASADEVRGLLERVRTHAGLLTQTSGRSGLGPRYRVIDGLAIRDRLPELVDYGEARVRPLVERLVGAPLRLLGSPRRSMRVQVYDRASHGFRWHVDGHAYAALLTLVNTNRGVTQIIGPGPSRVLRWLLYPCYAVPQVFSLYPSRSVHAGAGDLLVLAGGRLLHRGITLHDDGERVLVVYTYDHLGTRRSALRDRIATRLNY